MFGNPEVTPGGRALKFYSSIRLEVRRIETLKSGTDMIGNKVRVKVVKNKVAPPFKFTEFDILFGEGISHTGDLLDLGCTFGVIEKNGTWYSCNNERLGQGRDASRKFLKKKDDICELITKKVKEKIAEKVG